MNVVGLQLAYEPCGSGEALWTRVGGWQEVVKPSALWDLVKKISGQRERCGEEGCLELS